MKSQSRISAVDRDGRCVVLVLVAICALSSLATRLALAEGAEADRAPAARLTQAERDWLAEHPVIRVAPDPDFQPFEFFDESGTHRGIAADYLALLEEKLGIKFTIVQLETWSEVLESGKNRKIDMFSAATKTPQRAEYMLFTSPHISLPGVIITTTETEGALSLEQLHGKTVAVVSGYLWHDLLSNDHPEIKLITVPNIATALQMTSFAIVDATVGDQATTTHFIEKEGLINLRVAGKSGYTMDLAIATRKDWPELNGILEKGLRALSDKEKSQINSRWIHLKERSLFQRREFWLSLIVGVSAVLLIVGGILVWNRSLKRQVAARTKDLNAELVRRRQAEEELRKHRDHLDELVTVRTAELTVANERMKRDLQAAARVQQSLLPQSAPDVPGARFVWHYRPCDELAGDILNVFKLDKDHVGVYVADVSGHGVAASLLSVAISRVLTPVPSASSLLVQPGENASEIRIVPPMEVAEELNRRFPMEESDEKYFTILYGVLNLRTREFRFVSAGHPPIVRCAAGAEPETFDTEGLAIGWFPDAKYQEVVRHLNPGDRLCIYSDGVPEAMSPDLEEFGTERLMRILCNNTSRSLDDSLSDLLGQLEQWCGKAGPKDDVSILSLEIS